MPPDLCTRCTEEPRSSAQRTEEGGRAAAPTLGEFGRCKWGRGRPRLRVAFAVDDVLQQAENNPCGASASCGASTHWAHLANRATPFLAIDVHQGEHRVFFGKVSGRCDGDAGADLGKTEMLILLVEDNDLNRDMLTRRLARRGFRVESAADGEAALRLARDLRPDVILMDIGLPVIDGWEAIRQLKALPETREIPIITLTAHAFSEDRQRAEAAGCAGFVSKPIDLQHLLDTITQVGSSRPAK